MAELNEEPKRVHLDEVLGQLGAFGRHQAATMAMLALVYATNSMYNVNYVFAVEDVGYRYTHTHIHTHTNTALRRCMTYVLEDARHRIPHISGLLTIFCCYFVCCAHSTLSNFHT